MTCDHVPDEITPVDLSEIDPLQEVAVLRLILDAIEVGRSYPMPRDSEDVLRALHAIASDAFDRAVQR